MKTNLIDRARRYVAQMDPAVEGSGGHSATFAVACALVKGFDLTRDEALVVLSEYNERCSPPWSPADLNHKIASADAAGDSKPRGYLLNGEKRKPEEPGVAREPKKQIVRPRRYELAALRSFAEGCRQPIDKEWLAARSPVPVEHGNRPGLASDVLDFLFEPDDLVLMFKRQWSQGDFGHWRHRSFRLARERGVKAEPSQIPTESNAGMLLMCAPVDGQWRIVPGGYDKKGQPKWSRRNTSCVTRFPYLVLESDDAPVDLWLRALGMLELRIAAIFSSGGRSVHTLVRIDAGSKAEFDDCSRVMAAALEVVGADAQALKGLPMSRVPGVRRVETGRVQELLYLDPDPRWARLSERMVRGVSVPVSRDF